MAIAKMKRLRAIALARDREELLCALQSLGCVELTEPEPEDPVWSELLRRDAAPLSQRKAQSAAVEQALAALKTYAGVKKGLFIKRQEVSEGSFLSQEALERALETAEEINSRVREIRQGQVRLNQVAAQRTALQPWASLDLPLESGPTKSAYFTFALCPAAVELSQLREALGEKAPMAQLEEVSADQEQRYLLLLCHKTEEEEALRALRPYGFSPHSFKGLTGTAGENLDRLQGELTRWEERQQALEKELAAMGYARDTLRQASDRLAGETAKAAVTDRLLTNGTILCLQGWVPARRRIQVIQVLEDLGCAWDLSNPAEGENPPVLLQNNALLSSMNMVTEMYSLPAYEGIDPNPLIFPFFTLFYGFMFGDMGYGLVMFLAGLILTRRFHPKGTLGNILQLAMVCGVTSFVVGALTGGFFGDLIPVVADVFLHKEVILPSVINPLDDPMTVLIIGIAIGCFQLVVGQCIHIYMGIRDGEGLDAALDVVPWWVVFAGIGLLAVKGIPYLLLAGVVCLILTQGRHNKGILRKLWGGIASLYDVTSWLSDILSYSRLMALMLATTVIASVVNMLGTLPANLLIFIPIFLFGHTFNLGINLIGTYVHAARLQYLEYFGKFYKDGGRAFRPLRYETVYVDVCREKGQEVRE